MDDDERRVLAELAHVVGTEGARVELEALLLRALPSVLDTILGGMSRAIEREVVALHNRIDVLERDLGEALARERRRTHPNRRDS